MATSYDSSYIIHSKYFALKRNLKQKENQYEFLVNFVSDQHVTGKFLKKVIDTLKTKWICENFRVFVYICDKYNHDLTKQANTTTTTSSKSALSTLSASSVSLSTSPSPSPSPHSKQENDSTDSDMAISPGRHEDEEEEQQSYPIFDFTRDSKNVSVESHDSWNSVSSKCFLTSSSIFDWDFYELQWILSKFEAALGIFDRDSFFITPTYMRDVLNTPIHYDLVLYYIKKYINIYGKSNFHDNYYGLYLLSKDSVGRAILKFWYLETIDSSGSDRVKLIKRLHSIYHHDTPENHRFRMHLFYQSTCVPSVKQKFQINKYILSYLSFYGMYVDLFFLKDRHLEIERGIAHQKNIYLYQFYLSSASASSSASSASPSIVSQIQPLYDFFKKDNLIWISRKHVKRVKTPIFQFLYRNWDNNIRRNISLWDYRSINYADTQYSCGSPLISLFPKIWSHNFHQKDYTFVEEPVLSSIRRKKKL